MNTIYHREHSIICKNGNDSTRPSLSWIRKLTLSVSLAAAVLPANAEFHRSAADNRGINVAKTHAHLVARAQAARFLSEATFGGTKQEIDTLAARALNIGYIPAFEEWIDNQYTLPRGRTLVSRCYSIMGTPYAAAYLSNGSVRAWNTAWFSNALDSEDQLRDKMAYALSQILVTSGEYFNGMVRRRYMRFVNYYDNLEAHAFSNYRDTLQFIGTDSFMQSWLTNVKNPAASPDSGIVPDENFARECLQLFSMGIFALDDNGEFLYDEEGNIVENYTEEHIGEFAEALTGFHYRGSSFFAGADDLFPMGVVAFSNAHHDKSSKELNGVTLPAGQGISECVNQTYDHIANHPSTPPFFCRMLIKRFTHSNPSPNYVGRVVDAWYGDGPYGTEIVGDFKAVLKAILLDPEVRDASRYPRLNNIVRCIPRDPLGSKIKDTTQKMLQVRRFFKPSFVHETGYLANTNANSINGVRPMYSPTVFNFFNHDNIPTNGVIGEIVSDFETDNPGLTLVIEAPELQLYAGTVIQDQEAFRGLANRILTTNTGSNGFTYAAELPLESTSQTLDILDLYLCAGQMPYALKQKIKAKWPVMTEPEDFVNVLDSLYNSAAYTVTH